MNIEFKTLLTLRVSHAYYGETFRDLAFVIPSDTARILRNGKLLARELDGTLNLLFETGPTLTKIPGSLLRIGLQVTNPNFGNYTQLAADLGSEVMLYRNATALDVLDPPEKVSVASERFSHSLKSNVRPVTVTLTNAAGQSVHADTISDASVTSASYTLTGLDGGAYDVEEAYPTNTPAPTKYYVDHELSATHVFGVVEILIVNSFYNHPPAFELKFDALKQTLRYLVIANNYSDTEFNQLTPKLSVSDTGFTEDRRAEISFDSGIAETSLLGHDPARVVVFSSTVPIARSAKPRRRIQLNRNGEVLVKHLPQPGEDRCNADIIVPIWKP